MSRKTGIDRRTLDAIVVANKVREEISVDGKVTYEDIDRTRQFKDMPEEREKLLKLRAEDKFKSVDLRKVSKTLKEIPKPVRDAVLNEEVDYEDVEKRAEVGIPEKLAKPLVQELKREKKVKEQYEKAELEADISGFFLF